MFRLFPLPYLFTSGLLALAACAAPQSAPEESAEDAAAESAPDETVVAEESLEIPADTQLDALTFEQANAYCEYLQQEMKAKLGDDTMKKAGCLFSGAMAFFFSEDESACHAAQEECLASDLEEESFDDLCFSQEDLSACSATLAELTDCLNAAADYTFGGFRAFAELTCNDVTSDEGMGKMEEAMEGISWTSRARRQDTDEAFPDIDACAALREECPDLR